MASGKSGLPRTLSIAPGESYSDVILRLAAETH